MMRRTALATVMSLGLAVILTSSALAQNSQKVLIDLKFDEVFRQALAYVRELDSYSVDGSLVVRSQWGGLKQELPYNLNVVRKHPGVLSITMTEQAGAKVVARIIIYGEQGQVDAYLPREARLTAPPSASGEFPDTMALLMPLALSQILQYSSADRWLAKMRSAEYAGIEKDEKVERDHLKFSIDRMNVLRDLDMEMWADAGNKPLMQKLAIDLTRSLQGRAVGILLKGDMKIDMVLTFSNWNVNVEPPADRFTPPGDPGKFEILPLTEVARLSNSGATVTRPTTAQREQLIAQMKQLSPAERAYYISKLRGQVQTAKKAGTQGSRLRTRLGR